MKETAQERMERMKREREEAAKKNGDKDGQLIDQLTHQSAGEPDFSELAKKLEQRKAKEHKGENDDHVKMTIYVRSDVAAAFNALITKRGQQKEYVNAALIDFIQKKARELDIK